MRRRESGEVLHNPTRVFYLFFFFFSRTKTQIAQQRRNNNNQISVQSFVLSLISNLFGWTNKSKFLFKKKEKLECRSK
jgi:hypothetical protein